MFDFRNRYDNEIKKEIIMMKVQKNDLATIE